MQIWTLYTHMEFVVSEEMYKDIELPVTKENFAYKLMVIVDEHM